MQVKSLLEVRFGRRSIPVALGEGGPAGGSDDPGPLGGSGPGPLLDRLDDPAGVGIAAAGQVAADGVTRLGDDAGVLDSQRADEFFHLAEDRARRLGVAAAQRHPAAGQMANIPDVESVIARFGKAVAPRLCFI